jgi:hypothetical protein
MTNSVSRQSSDPEFKNIINQMREGYVNHESADLLLGCCLSRLPPEKRCVFYLEGMFLSPKNSTNKNGVALLQEWIQYILLLLME